MGWCECAAFFEMISSVSIGPLIVHFYGLFLGIAIAVGWWWASRLIRLAGGDEKRFEVVGIWAVVGGVVGARLYHVVDYWWYYSQHMVEAFFLWQGGLGIWGAIGGGFVGGVIACRNQWGSLPQYLDAMAFAMPLSQAIGRWGNWVNYELYGKPTSLPWKWYIPQEFRPTSMTDIAYYHPLFLYESLLSLGLFFCLYWWFKPRSLGRMYGFGAFLMGYGLIRFVLEPFRISPWIWNGIPVAQIISLVSIGIGGWWWIRQLRGV